MTDKSCPFCAETIKAEAIRCKHCHADLTQAPTPTPKKFVPAKYKSGEVREWKVDQRPAFSATKSKSGMGTTGKVLITLAVLDGAFLLFGATVGNTPEAKERTNSRSAVELCWQEQKRASLTPETQRFIAGACEKMESDFVSKHGVKSEIEPATERAFFRLDGSYSQNYYLK